MSQIETPILLIAFNRPKTTKIAFESIKKVRPKKLYVVIDGPRDDKPGEKKLCDEVLSVTKDVDWDCDAKYLIREKNVGCKYGVSGGISWVLSYEDRVIIIEDDIVAPPAFFFFAEDLLEKYRDNENIAMISGNNYSPINSIEDDYLFSKYGHIWGWATWKRVWDKFDVDDQEIFEAVRNNFDEIEFDNESERRFYDRYFRKLSAKMLRNEENAWGPQFSFFRFQNKLLSIVPKTNLASNIGETSSRTNNVSVTNTNYFAADDSFVLENHPIRIERNVAFDKLHFKKHINGMSFIAKLIYKIKNYKK